MPCVGRDRSSRDNSHWIREDWILNYAYVGGSCTVCTANDVNAGHTGFMSTKDVVVEYMSLEAADPSAVQPSACQSHASKILAGPYSVCPLRN